MARHHPSHLRRSSAVTRPSQLNIGSVRSPLDAGLHGPGSTTRALPPESQVRNRLFAGGSWIRTVGPFLDGDPVRPVKLKKGVECKPEVEGEAWPTGRQQSQAMLFYGHVEPRIPGASNCGIISTVPPGFAVLSDSGPE